MKNLRLLICMLTLIVHMKFLYDHILTKNVLEQKWILFLKYKRDLM